MRSTSELLKLIRNRRNKLNVPCVGLCGWINNCYDIDLITEKERDRLFKVLYDNKPQIDEKAVWWFPNDGIERGKFLNRLIKKYS